jgi:predicted kinase
MQKSNQHLILLRGLPGAGKTAFAQLISENNTYPFFSVDDYFTDKDGKYKFEFSENYKAYAHCLSNTENAIKNGISKVIVHNTFTMDWEMEPYFKLSLKYECNLHVLTIENYHDGKNSHHVTDEQLSKMAEKYQVKLF